MRIRTQFFTTMILFGVILLLVAVSVIMTRQQTGKAIEQEKIANNIAQTANELGYLSTGYLIYGESHQLKRWQSRFVHFSAQMASLHPQGAEEEALLSQIRGNQQRLREVFDSAASTLGNSSPGQKSTLDLAIFQASMSRMTIQTLGLVSDASRLSQLFRDRVDRSRRSNLIVVLTMMGVFGAYFLINHMMIQRRILKSIGTLRAGTQVIGSGNLDFVIEEKRKDEIGELALAFNRMAADLKAVTASKADLEREIFEREKAQISLRESEQRWATTLASIGDAVIATDVSGRVTFMNPVAESLTGWGLKEASRRPVVEVFNIINEQTRQQVESPVTRVLAEGNVVGLANHTILVGRDGKEFPIDDSGAPIRDPNGKTTGVVLVFRDITERKGAEKELQEAHERAVWLARFPEENPSPVARVSSEGNILYRNPAAAKTPGWAFAVGQPSPARFLQLIKKAMMDGKEIEKDVEMGERVYAIRIFPFPGERYANVYAHDVTEQKRIEGALRTSEERLRTFIEQAPASLAMFDREMRYLGASRRWLSDYGLGNRELKGQSHYEIFPGIPDRWKEAYRRALSGEVVHAEGDRFERADGSVRWLRWEVRPWHDTAGAIAGVVIFTEDVTERQHREYRISRLSKLYAVLSQVNEAIVRTHDEDRLYGEVCRIVAEEGGFPLVWVGQVQERQVVPKACCGPASEYLQEIKVETEGALGRGPTGTCAREDHTVINDDFDINPAASPWRKPALRFGFRASAAFPLHRQGRVVGVLTLYSPEPGAFDREQVDLLEALCADVSYALEAMEQERRRNEAEENLRRRTLELQQLTESLERRVRDRTEELRMSHQRLQILSSQLLLAQEKERKRVAVELHDGLMSELAATKFLLEGKVMLLDQGKSVQPGELRRVADILANIMKEARRLMNNLHPSILDELGLIATISWMCAEYQKSYSHITVQRELTIAEKDISDSIKVVVYRLLQEALNNFARHGKGDRIDLSLSKSDNAIALTIRDNGQGFDLEKAPKGLGLESMRERVEISGGEFQIKSILGRGTTIRAIWRHS